jgi:hypothetical protein
MLVNIEVSGLCANCVMLHPPWTFGHLPNILAYMKLIKNILRGN